MYTKSLTIKKSYNKEKWENIESSFQVTPSIFENINDTSWYSGKYVFRERKPRRNG